MKTLTIQVEDNFMNDFLNFVGSCKDKIKIVNGLQNELKILSNFGTESQKFRFFDCLSCPGGCIGGPGMISKEPTQTKIQKVRNYLYQTTKEKDKWEEGKSEDTTGISFESNFN